ncbi:glycosyltransferase family 2 protein [Streptomonospora nanhaiensis]|uniref:Glycosyltransferase 2-like domain-containing protein n=1 Tax=Streptomonospora nanhaiensis TaxID=1323731 RepID=A0A853BU41_9ACTN|nr:glycosyltransferase [Streptomonospora nanhaiensis]MBV2366211.1 glycosyltransferase [Streptomonospora nanhaiensis]NYI98276.1 hypothetical protein [Streptomonospora nanhaiensis]
MTPEISVVVSVRGNAHRLPTLLCGLDQQTTSAPFEVLVVDNDPPRTAPRARQHAGGGWSFPLHHLREREAGLSRGRNTGIRAARGAFIAVTDPDITPAPTWLEALVEAARSTDAACVGGRVEVTYPQGAVREMTRGQRECHGPLDWPTATAPFGWPYWLCGCNLLLTREALAEHGLFRTDLGRRGRWKLDAEDLEIAERLSQAGRTVVITPDAVVSHPVYRRETTAGYFLANGAGHGICVARMHQSVRVVPAAIRAGAGDIADALTDFARAWGFLRPELAVDGARELARIGAYRAERLRLRLTRARRVTPPPLTARRPLTLPGA